MVKEMVVPLPRQAVELLCQQKKLNDIIKSVFYSATAKKHYIISENTATKQLNKLGYQGIRCVHGFRTTAKTIL